MSLHRPPKRFGIEGQVKDDAMFIRVRQQYEAAIISDMRERGYVPLLDFGPFFSTVYDEELDRYDFVLSVYGVYVGVKRAPTLEGVDGSGKWYKREKHGTVHGEAD